MNRLRIVVAGLIGAFPMSGVTMHWLQYVLGLRELGHDVLYLEDTGAWYYDPRTDKVVESNSIPINHLKITMDTYGLSNSWTFIDHRGKQFGVTGSKFSEFLATADLLVHVTGTMFLRDDYMRIPQRAYIDTDPGFIQLRIAKGSQRDLDHLERHTVHFSFGCNIGASDCLIPTAGFTWYPTVQPICMSLWPMTPAPRTHAPFTTVVKWQGYDPVEFNGEIYGLKDVEFLKFLRLPEMMAQPFELAMVGRPPVPIGDLEAAGWKLRSGQEISSTFESYRHYIQASRGEWSVAKNGYVKTGSGWFSDRSAAYLASGRPVVLQTTGFERWLPTGSGVIEFSTIEEAKSAIASVNNDYYRHCRSARELAESFFESGRVLRSLIDTAMAV